jgi:sulfur carrier protein
MLGAARTPGQATTGRREAQLTSFFAPAYLGAMKLTVNGEERAVPEGLTLVGLLAHLGVDAQRVAIEVNRALVPRARHAEQRLTENDVVEIVTFVGGG